MEKCLIVAVADNLAIGRAGAMPWHISEDLKFFRRTTMSCPVIMGRTTYMSLGRPLPHRRNIVLSRSMSAGGDVEVAGSLAEAYSLVPDAPRVFVMGGASVYREALPDMDTLYVTRVHISVPDADTFFPIIDPAVWKESSRSGIFTDPESGAKFEFVSYTRWK